MTDESGIDYAAHIEALLDGALGPQGYYGVFTANMHTDDPRPRGRQHDRRGGQAARRPRRLGQADARLARRPRRLVVRRPRRSTATCCSSRSSRASGANGLEAMLPADGPTGALTAVRRNGAAVATERADARRHRLRRLRRGRRELHGDLREPAGHAGARDDDHRLLGDRQTPRALRSRPTRAGATFQCRLDSGAFVRLRAPRASSPVSPPASTPSRSARPQAAGRIRPPPPAASPSPPPRPAAAARRPWAEASPAARARSPGRRRARRRSAGPLASAHGRPDASRPELERRRRHAARDVPGRRSGAAASASGSGSGSATSGRARSRVTGGETKRFRIQLKRSARAKLAIEGSLRVTAVAVARDDAGNEGTVRKTVRILAPKAR